MDNEKPDKIIGVDVFRERKAKQLIQKWEYQRITDEDLVDGMLRLKYPMEVIEIILESGIE
jgi:hypothetical protein